MNVRLPILALLLLAAPLAAPPAEAAYLSCNPSTVLPVDPAGCVGCRAVDAGVTVVCVTLSVACVDNTLVVAVTGQATASVTWDVWFGSDMALYHVGPATGDRYVNEWRVSAYGGDHPRAWVHVNGREVAHAEGLPCLPPQ